MKKYCVHTQPVASSRVHENRELLTAACIARLQWNMSVCVMSLPLSEPADWSTGSFGALNGGSVFSPPAKMSHRTDSLGSCSPTANSNFGLICLCQHVSGTAWSSA